MDLKDPNTIVSAKPVSALCVQNIGLSGTPGNDGYTIKVTYLNSNNKKKILLFKVINANGTMIVDEIIKVNGGSGSYARTLTTGDGPWIVSVTDPCNGLVTTGQYGL